MKTLRILEDTHNGSPVWRVRVFYDGRAISSETVPAGDNSGLVALFDKMVAKFQPVTVESETAAWIASIRND